ncbi:Orotidine 5'-phosphate decarboxylase [Colletotrichum sp. SAR11_240]|nr:Orotidine 5'-phosphate decarboxylase [Colletotrichum sp. SAR11_240]
MLKCAYDIGPYIAVFKTHIDMISDFSDLTINGLRAIARTHNFLIFEDRKFVDIGHTVIGQYHGGALRISEWADIVNLSILGGEGIVDALDQTIRHPSFPFQGQRALLLLAEMTSQGSLAGGEYTERSAEGDELGQQYQTPRSAVLGGSDFIIAGRGILGATSPVAEAIRYRREGWEAYLDRTGQR